MTEFIKKDWIKISEFPHNFIPHEGIEFSQYDENNECRIKGFYEPKTGSTHIQEVEYT